MTPSRHKLNTLSKFSGSQIILGYISAQKWNSFDTTVHIALINKFENCYMKYAMYLPDQRELAMFSAVFLGVLFW